MRTVGLKDKSQLAAPTTNKNVCLRCFSTFERQTNQKGHQLKNSKIRTRITVEK